MSRETKSDRLARQMFDQMSEHLHELQSIAANIHAKENDVERWVQSFLRSCLGFSASNGFSVRAQESKGKMRPDLIVLKDEKPILVVEVKKLDANLDKAELRSGKTQLKQYLGSLDGVTWGMLCNGYEWRLYDFSNAASGGVQVHSIDIRGESETLDVSKRSVEDTCYAFVDLHENVMAAGAWKELAREATAFSPESIASAILSGDVVKYIARIIRGEHDFKANLEVLFDKIADVVERGLNDTVPEWNDARRAEMQKHIKSQKRATRRKKRSKSGSGQDQAADGVEAMESAAVASEPNKATGTDG